MTIHSWLHWEPVVVVGMKPLWTFTIRPTCHGHTMDAMGAFLCGSWLGLGWTVKVWQQQGVVERILPQWSPLSFFGFIVVKFFNIPFNKSVTWCQSDAGADTPPIDGMTMRTFDSSACPLKESLELQQIIKTIRLKRAKVHINIVLIKRWKDFFDLTLIVTKCLWNGGSQTRSEALRKWIQRWRRFAVYGIVSSSTGDHQFYCSL